MLLGVTGRARAVGELIELIIGDELSDADGMSLSKVLIWSKATCGEASIAKFEFWITSSSGIMRRLLVGLLKKTSGSRSLLKKANEKAYLVRPLTYEADFATETIGIVDVQTSGK